MCSRSRSRSRYTGTSVMSWNIWYTVRSHVLSLHALTLCNTLILSFQIQYKYQSAVYILEWATPSLTVWFTWMRYENFRLTFDIWLILADSVIIVSFLLLMLVAGCGGMLSNSVGAINVRRQADTDCVWLLSAPVGSQIRVWLSKYFFHRCGSDREINK